MNSASNSQNPQFKLLTSALDVLVLLAWGALLLKYWATGQLRLLIHPNYFGLVFLAGILLLALAGFQAWQLGIEVKTLRGASGSREQVQHITLFPPGWGSGLLAIAAVLGLLIPPSILTSQIALQRGVAESLPLTESQIQAFRSETKPEQRSLIDWVRTLNAYPEPDAYAGQKAKVSGFVIPLPNLPQNYLFLARFVITCCAVDAYPVGIPVKLESSSNAYPPDTWLAVEGEMMPEMLPPLTANGGKTAQEKRQLVLVAKSVQKIPPPADPYNY